MDYKVFCFNGEPKMIQLDYNRFSGHLRNLYTADWKRIDATLCYPTNPDKEFERPEELETMLEAARKLSKGMPHVRADFYIVNHRVLFGELTLFHGSGFEVFTPSSWDERLGSWITLPEKK